MENKRILALLMLIAMAFTLVACGDSQEKAYKSASKMLDEGKYAEAAAQFEKLGSYEDASQMTMYAKALNEAESGNYDTALKTFTSLGAFKDSPQMITYYTARELESEYDFTSAIEVYNENPLFKDSQERIEENKKNKLDTSHSFSFVANIPEVTDLVLVEKNWQVGLMDTLGNLIIPCKFDDIGFFTTGLFPLKLIISMVVLTIQET